MIQANNSRTHIISEIIAHLTILHHYYLCAMLLGNYTICKRRHVFAHDAKQSQWTKIFLISKMFMFLMSKTLHRGLMSCHCDTCARRLRFVVGLYLLLLYRELGLLLCRPVYISILRIPDLYMRPLFFYYHRVNKTHPSRAPSPLPTGRQDWQSTHFLYHLTLPHTRRPYTVLQR